MLGQWKVLNVNVFFEHTARIWIVFFFRYFDNQYRIIKILPSNSMLFIEFISLPLLLISICCTSKCCWSCWSCCCTIGQSTNCWPLSVSKLTGGWCCCNCCNDWTAATLDSKITFWGSCPSYICTSFDVCRLSNGSCDVVLEDGDCFVISSNELFLLHLVPLLILLLLPLSVVNGLTIIVDPGWTAFGKLYLH